MERDSLCSESVIWSGGSWPGASGIGDAKSGRAVVLQAVDAASNASSKSVISADVECNLPETQAQHLLHAVRSPRLKASDSDPRPTPLAYT